MTKLTVAAAVLVGSFAALLFIAPAVAVAVAIALVVGWAGGTVINWLIERSDAA